MKSEAIPARIVLKDLTFGTSTGLRDLHTTDAWRSAFPGAHAGVVAMSAVRNPERSTALEDLKAKLEMDLRRRFEGMNRTALRAHPILAAYERYYRRFDKTYHVQLQLESIVLKGKAIPSSAALVESMFMAEVNSLLLTAGHDLDAVQLPLTDWMSHAAQRRTLSCGGAPRCPRAETW